MNEDCCIDNVYICQKCKNRIIREFLEQKIKEIDIEPENIYVLDSYARGDVANICQVLINEMEGEKE